MIRRYLTSTQTPPVAATQGKDPRRKMRVLFLLMIHLLVTGYGFSQTPKVYVFLPSNIRAKAMEQVLGGACPQLEITVFGRLRGFSSEVETNPPDAILVIQPLIRAHEDFAPLLIGAKDGSTTEKYALLSVEKPVVLDNVPQMEIGVLDLLGRRHMDGFVEDMIGGSKKTRTVAKYEDLLSLLQFQDAGAVLVPLSKVSYYTGKSRLNLVVTEIPKGNVGLAVLAVKSEDPAVREILKKAFMGLEAVVNEKLGVDAWVEPAK